MTNQPKNRRVQITSKEEPLTVVRLEDGTVVKIQVVVFGAHLLLNDDGSPKLHPDNSPMYAINQQLCIFIDTFESVPEGIKKN